MSIAINVRRINASVRTREAIAADHAVASPDDQLREMRAILRHLVLSVLGAGTVLYAIVASGLSV